MMKSTSIALFLAAISSASAQAFMPFGVGQGTTIAQVKAMGGVYNSKNKLWRLDKVPTPNSAFDFYSVTATNETGVCKVTGIGATINTSKDGAALKRQFNSLLATLKNRYGKSKDFNFLHAGSIWDEDSDFMYALDDDQYTLTSFFDVEERSNLPKGIAAITVYAAALDSTTGFVNVSYQFDNYEKCKAILDKADSNGL